MPACLNLDLLLFLPSCLPLRRLSSSSTAAAVVGLFTPPFPLCRRHSSGARPRHLHCGRLSSNRPLPLRRRRSSHLLACLSSPPLVHSTLPPSLIQRSSIVSLQSLPPLQRCPMEGSLAQEPCSSQGSPCLSNRETVPSSTVNISKCDGNEIHEDGSLWGNSDEEADDAPGLDREWQNRHDQFYNRGYRDGITAGQNASVQEGFNGGFKDSVLVGYKWGLVRGVTSSLAFLPDQTKAKMIETEESKREFQCLGESVQSISTEDALKLFHEDLDSDLQKQIGSTKDRHDRGTGFKLLEIFYGKLLELAQNSPAVNVHMGTDEKKVSSQFSLP